MAIGGYECRDWRIRMSRWGAVAVGVRLARWGQKIAISKKVGFSTFKTLFSTLEKIFCAIHESWDYIQSMKVIFADREMKRVTDGWNYFCN